MPVVLPAASIPSIPLVPLGLALCCALPLASCATPVAEPLDAADLSRSLDRRAEDPATLEAALELAQRAASPFELPTLTALADPSDAGHLRAQVLLNAPAIRNARSVWLAAASRDARAAASAPLELGAKLQDEPGDEESAELELTVDLLGLFGAGRAGAARAIATAEQRRALAQLWEATWTSLHDVERARVRAVAARERLARLRELLVESERDTTRIDVLAVRGYARPDQAKWALAVRSEIQDRVVHERIELARREAELATAVGWRIERARAWLDAHGAEQRAIEAPIVPPPEPRDTRALLAEHPALLAARLDHAIAEARLFAAARESVPELRVGPQLRREENETLGGVLFGLDVAWPAAVRAQVRALEHERAGARERLEDRLLAQSNELAAREEVLRLERDESVPRATAVDAGAAAMWTTARDRFANQLDAIDEWSFALEHRVPPLLELVDAREHVELAAIDCSETSGSPLVGRTELARRAWEVAR